MSRVRPAVLAACLIGALASACSLVEEEIKKKGIASVVNIFSRLRKGSADEDYIACMKRRGYEVKP
jgi:hypothetical protein